eukprot:scaffold75442_cov15-Tisochrysis_lutea.AAC.1
MAAATTPAAVAHLPQGATVNRLLKRASWDNTALESAAAVAAAAASVAVALRPQGAMFNKWPMGRGWDDTAFGIVPLKLHDDDSMMTTMYKVLPAPEKPLFFSCPCIGALGDACGVYDAWAPSAMWALDGPILCCSPPTCNLHSLWFIPNRWQLLGKLHLATPLILMLSALNLLFFLLLSSCAQGE